MECPNKKIIRAFINKIVTFIILACYAQVFIKSELKVGVIYVKENQYTEEEILDNNENSPLFDEFLQVLGEKVRLKGWYSIFRLLLTYFC